MPTDATTPASGSFSAIVPSPTMAISQSAPSIVLSDFTWDEYVALRDKSANRHLRMTYSNGDLEIMTISEFHELISLIVHDFISEWRVVRRIPVRPTGSMTLRRHSIDRGLEGDQSYYIANEAKVRRVTVIDLEQLPPPDLAIDVEHTSMAMGKMPIYAKLQVPEVWRFRDEVLRVFCLDKDGYHESESSHALPGFPLDHLRSALSRRHDVDETSLVAEFRRSLTSE